MALQLCGGYRVPIIGRNVAVPAPLSCPALYATFSSQRSPPPRSWIWLQNFSNSNPDPTVPGQKTFKQRNLFMKLDSAFSVQDNDIFKNGGGGGGSQRFSPASWFILMDLLADKVPCSRISRPRDLSSIRKRLFVLQLIYPDVSCFRYF